MGNKVIKNPKSPTAVKRKTDDKKDKDISIKVLLLGTSGAGKSTLLKQLQLIYTGNSTDKSVASDVIYGNIVKTLRSLCENCNHNLDIKYQIAANAIREIPDTISNPTAEIVEHIKTLWENPKIKETYRNREKIHCDVPECSDYLCDRVEKYYANCIEPEDIIRAHRPTVGTQSLEVTIDDLAFEVTEFGGEKAERSKWQLYNDSVSLIIYVVDISSYTKSLPGDDSINRLLDSYQFFQSLLCNKKLEGCNFVLVFSKIEQFNEKLKNHPLTSVFSDYTGQDEPIEFIQKKFMNGSESQRVQSFVVNMLDINEVKQMILSVAASLNPKSKNIYDL